MKADGRLYAAKIVKVNGFEMFVVQFERPVEEVTVPLKKLRIFDHSDATPAKAASKPGVKGKSKSTTARTRGAQRQDSA